MADGVSGLEALGLADSAMLASVDDRDKSLWRFAATLVFGLLAGLAAGLLAGGLALGIYALGAGLVSGNLSALGGHVVSAIKADGSNLTSALMILTLAVATNCPLALTFIAIAAVSNKHKVREYVTAAPRFRWRLLLTGIVLSVVLIGPMLLIGQLMDPKAARPPLLALSPDLGARALYAVACIALLIPAAAAEEVVFRGWFLRQTSVLTRNPWLLMAVNGAAFSAVHGEFGLDAFLTRALMGAGFVYMTLRLGGTELSIGAHAANNILIVLFLQPLSLKPAPPSAFDTNSLLQDVVLVAAYVAMTEIALRWPALRRWTGADQAPPRAPVTAPAGPWA